MSTLERIDPTQQPIRGEATVFCDRCKALKPCKKFQSRRGGVEWLCSETCAPNPQEIIRDIVAHSPPPPDPAPSALLDQWLEPIPPADLDADIPQEMLDLEIDAHLAAMDELRESEPIGAERGTGAHDLTDTDQEGR